MFLTHRRRPSTPLVGESSLIGEYTCPYCRGPFAQQFRFERNGKSFCGPSCELAYAKCHRIPHDDIERKYGRCVLPAPPPRAVRLKDRTQWLQDLCNALDDDDDAQKMQMEWIVLEKNNEARRGPAEKGVPLL